jgi:3-isopropylmalate/(R)-2-methylmalate dehydratase small subunit
VVIGSRFGDIFRSNSGKAGLLIATVAQDVVEKLWTYAETNPGAEITVNLSEKQIVAGGNSYDFEIDDYTRYRLINGLDDIGLTLTHDAEIAAYEGLRPSFKPRTLPARTAG